MNEKPAASFSTGGAFQRESKDDSSVPNLEYAQTKLNKIRVYKHRGTNKITPLKQPCLIVPPFCSDPALVFLPSPLRLRHHPLDNRLDTGISGLVYFQGRTWRSHTPDDATDCSTWTVR